MFYNRQGWISSGGFKLLLVCLCLLVSGIIGIAAEKGRTGCFLSKHPDSEFLQVWDVVSYSPAAKAGIKTKDTVVAIDGVSTSGMNASDWQNRIRGEIGKSVTFTIRRKGESDRQVAIPFQSAPDVFSQAAQEGDAIAQYGLGVYYAYGAPVLDPKKGAEWLKKSAAQNYVQAMPELGHLYRWGEGVPQSYKDAFAWYYCGAMLGDATSAQQLGILYKAGQGTEKNDNEAFAWLSYAAEKGEPYAQWNLADLYLSGRGVKKNAGEALQWYRKAQVSLPKEKDLQKDVFEASLAAFSENPEAFSIDPTELMTNYRPIVIGVFVLLAAIYVVGLVPLLIFTLKKTSAPPTVLTASGWMLFYIESQGVAMLAMPLLGMAFSAEGLIGMVGVFSCAPVIVSSLGSNRPLLWKTPSGTWLQWLLYVAGGVVAIGLCSAAYSGTYYLITHHPMPSQPTVALITAAEHHAPWLAYASVVLLMPVTEEIIFRGYFYDALRKHFSPNVVMLLTALSFAGIHLQLLYFVPLFALGMVLGWLKSKTGSIRLTVAIHVVNNLIALLFLQ